MKRRFTAPLFGAAIALLSLAATTQTATTAPVIQAILVKLKPIACIC